MRDEIGWLPPPQDEYPTTCVKLLIPDNLEYRAAFWGALGELAKGHNWQVDNDEDRELAISRYWSRLIHETMTEDCEGDLPLINFRFTDDCGLEYQVNLGDWTPVAGWSDLAPICFAGADGPAGPTGSTGATGPAGNNAGFDDDGDIPTPEGTPSEDKKCKVATAIAEGMLLRYHAWLDAWLAVLLENANNYNAAFNQLSTNFNDIALYGTGLAAGTPGQALTKFGAMAVIDVLGIGAAISGFLAYFAGKDALNWLAIEAELEAAAFKDELICLVLASLGTDGDLTAVAWGEIRAAISSMAEASAAALNEFRTYFDNAVPVAIARTMALKSPLAWDCAVCEEQAGLCDPLDMLGYTHAVDFCFRDSNYGMILPTTFNRANPVWVEGEGFKTGWRVASTVGYREVQIQWPRNWENFTLANCIFRIEFTYVQGTSFGGTASYGLLRAGAGGSIVHWNVDRTAIALADPVFTSAVQNRNFGGGAPLTLAIRTGQSGGSADPGGEATIHRFTVLHNNAVAPYVVLPEEM